MTGKEAIKFAEYAHRIAIPQETKEFYALAEAALRELEERQWVPVTERLPENDDFVLVTADGTYGNITLKRAMELARYVPAEDWILEMFPEWKNADVTHWMPLPEPPEGNAHENS